MTLRSPSATAESISTPRNERRSQIRARTRAEFSPTPAVKTIASSPPAIASTDGGGRARPGGSVGVLRQAAHDEGREQQEARLDRSRVRFLPPNETNDELFFVEEERLVRADNTFSFKGLRFEAPRHLPDRTVQIRFQRSRPTARLVVFYKGERMGEARPLNAIANDRKPLNPPATGI